MEAGSWKVKAGRGKGKMEGGRNPKPLKKGQ